MTRKWPGSSRAALQRSCILTASRRRAASRRPHYDDVTTEVVDQRLESTRHLVPVASRNVLAGGKEIGSRVTRGPASGYGGLGRRGGARHSGGNPEGSDDTRACADD